MHAEEPIYPSKAPLYHDGSGNTAAGVDERRALEPNRPPAEMEGRVYTELGGSDMRTELPATRS